jgi:hypothetical protein
LIEAGEKDTDIEAEYIARRHDAWSTSLKRNRSAERSGRVKLEAERSQQFQCTDRKLSLQAI